MGYSIVLVFFLMIIALLLPLIKRKSVRRKIFYFRILLTTLSVGVFVYFFTIRSIFSEGLGNVSIKISNNLPQTIDSYILRKNQEANSYFIRHYGKIHPSHYREKYVNMGTTDEYWVVGYTGKKNMVYFTQHFYQMDSFRKIDVQEVSVNHHINQSKKLSKLAKKAIEEYQNDRVSFAIIITMSLLLLFMNIVLLFKIK